MWWSMNFLTCLSSSAGPIEDEAPAHSPHSTHTTGDLYQHKFTSHEESTEWRLFMHPLRKFVSLI
jgi:hypothetical protein